jgi:hypothetical protein
MSKEMTLIVLGIWVAVVPYLGIPGMWRTALLVLSGIGIAIIGFLLRGEVLGRGVTSSKHTTFVDNVTSSRPAAPDPSLQTHEHKEGITSLN